MTATIFRGGTARRILAVTVFLNLSFFEATSAQSVAKNSVAPGLAKVLVYRYKQFVGAALEPSVYCDDRQLARMDNGRFFVVEIPPGKHEFRSNDKQSGVELSAQAGETYYLRVEIATGLWKGHGRLVRTDPEQGAYEVKQLRPLDPDKIKDKTLVVATAGFSGEQ